MLLIKGIFCGLQELSFVDWMFTVLIWSVIGDLDLFCSFQCKTTTKVQHGSMGDVEEFLEVSLFCNLFISDDQFLCLWISNSFIN